MVKTYKEVGWYESYGVAKISANKVKSTMKDKKCRVFIFKDLSDTPFTSFRTDRYVVAVEVLNERD